MVYTQKFHDKRDNFGIFQIMVPILANLCCLEAHLVSNCRIKNSLNAHTTCLVIKELVFIL